MIALHISSGHINGEEDGPDTALAQARKVRVVFGRALDISAADRETGDVVMRVDENSGLPDLFHLGIELFARWRTSKQSSGCQERGNDR